MDKETGPIPAAGTAEVQVAVGVIVDDRRAVLLTRRSQHVHQGGLWEFPGGKVEAGESVTQALSRELHEELAIRVRHSEPLLQVRHDYGDKRVCLEVRLVREWSGRARGLEGQPLVWAPADALADYAFPAANAPIVTALREYLAC